MLQSPEEFYVGRHALHGDIFLTHLILRPTIVISGEKLMREAYAQERKYVFTQLTSSSCVVFRQTSGTCSGNWFQLY